MSELSYRAGIGQTRHWRLQTRLPESAALNVGFALHLDGKLDRDALAGAVGELYERHGALRSSFALRGDELWVTERPAAGWQLPVSTPPRVGREGADQVLATEAARPFDLAEGVFRACLVISGPEQASLGVVFHHSVFDGWSFNVFFGELAALYVARSSGQPSPLAESPRPYGEFAEWQRAAAESSQWDRQLDYWREQLSGFEPRPTLPRDRDPGTPPHRVALAALTLTSGATEQVEQAARRLRTLPFVVLLAAYQATLSARGHADDCVVGSPFVGRRGSSWRGTIGLFVNTVPLRANLASNPTLADLVAQTRTSVRGGHANQDVPLDRVMADHLDAPSFAGLFDTLAQMQSARRESVALGGLSVDLAPLWNVHTKYDLLVSFGRRPDSLVGLFEYNADAFDESTVLGLVGGYAGVLAALCRRPDRRVSELGHAEELDFRPVRGADLPSLGLRSVMAETGLA